MSLNAKRAVAELKELRALTADENGAQRVAWTDVWLKARQWFAAKVKELPVEQHRDAAGNSWVTLRGESEKALLVGGHLDSVVDACSFGIAPTLLLHACGMRSAPEMALLVFFAACAVCFGVTL